MAGFAHAAASAKSQRHKNQRPHPNAHGRTQLLIRQLPSYQRPMAGNQQYQFPPPPPPPPSGPPPPNYPQNPQYGYAQPPPHQGPPRGGGGPRGGRGGNQGGRGDFHPSGPYQHGPGYGGPPQGPPQGPPAGYNAQSPGYVGPQAPGPQNGPPGPQGGYPGPQWNEQHGPQHGPQQPHGPMQQTPQPAPLSAQNYHPNYAPQAYQGPPSQQYGPPQPPQQFQQHPPSYGHSVPPQQTPHGGAPPPQQWSGSPPHHGPQQFRGRGRGGFSGGRGGHEVPLMGPPIRMGFDSQEREHMAQAGNGFPPQYPNQQSPPAPFSQPSYQGYPPQNFSQRPPLDPNPYSASPYRGRGNMNFRGRGRGDFQFRGRDNRHNGAPRASSESYHKPAGVGLDGKKKKKRRTNTLGLTPNGVDHESSDEEVDDVDEEARLVTLLGPDTPSLPADLDAWLAERKSRYPTKARREAAEEELRKRHEQAQDPKAADSHDKSIKKEDGETKLERQQRKAEKLRAELEKAERRIQDSMSGSKRKRENGDDGDEERGQVSDEDSGDSDSGSEGSKPEAMSSRATGPMRVAQPPKAQLQRHCKYFSTGGTCGKKGKCRFVHDQEVRTQALKDKEANGGKMTLAQRLILNDTAKDDLTILKSIKYLKEKGLMSDQLSATPIKSEDVLRTEVKIEENGYTHLDY